MDRGESLWEIILIKFIDVEKLILLLSGTIPWAGDPGLFKMEEVGLESWLID